MTMLLESTVALLALSLPAAPSIASAGIELIFHDRDAADRQGYVTTRQSIVYRFGLMILHP